MDDEERKLKLLWGNIMQQTDTAEEPSSQAGAAGGQDPAATTSSAVNLMELAPADNANVTQSREELARLYTWDAVFVFAVGEEDKTVKVWDADEGVHKTVPQQEHFRTTTADIVDRLQQAGLYTSMYYSVQKDEVYVKVAASELRLQQEADRVDFDLQLDHAKCLEYAKALGVRLASYTVRDDEESITESAWLNIYGHYDQLDPDRAFRQELYVRYNTADPNHPRFRSFFSATNRIKLMVGLIEADAELGGAEISFTRLEADKKHSMLAFFPLHDARARDELVREWKTARSVFKAPVHAIREYFGESIAFYFCFLSFYNRQLVWPALIGIGFFVAQMIVGRVDIAPIPVYALYISLWATFFTEMWKRQEAKLRIRFGMTKFLQKESARPEFTGEWKPSPIDGRKVEVFPFHIKLKRALFSQSVVWTMVLLVIAAVAATFFFRTLVVSWSPTYGGYLVAVVNAIVIMVANAIYSKVSINLNAYENHRTDTEYFNALIAKSFLFKFVNSYSSLFYIAFFKKYDDFARQDGDATGCLNDNCLAELRTQLSTIFITMIVVNNTIEVLTPILQERAADRANRVNPSVFDDESGPAPVKSPPEEEFELAPYESTFDDFDELVIQYGYVTLFVVAFPLAPLLALMNNFVEVAVDATKVCNSSRRSEPRGAANIGTWFAILEIVGFIAVIVNCALIAFAAPIVDEWLPAPESKAYAFIFAEHFIFLLKLAIAFFVPDEPEEYHTHVARQEYIVNVLLNGLEEEDDDDLEEGAVSSKKEFDWSAVADRMPETTHDI